LKELSVFSKE